MPGDTSRENGKKGGRPKGSERPVISDDITEKQRKTILKRAYDKAVGNSSKGDSLLLKHLIEQVYGKPRQAIEHSTDPNNPLELKSNLPAGQEDWVRAAIKDVLNEVAER